MSKRIGAMAAMWGCLLIAVIACLAADTYTTRAGLRQPEVGVEDTALDWGTKINRNFDILDSSAALQGAANTFTSSNTFKAAVQIDGAVTLSSPTAVTGSLSATTGLTASSATLTQTSATLPGLDVSSTVWIRDGKLAIGTTAPGSIALLHVYQSVNDTIVGRFQNPNTGTGVISSVQIMSDQATGAFQATGSGYSGSGALAPKTFSLAAGNGANSLNFYTVVSTATIRFYTGGSATTNERVQISSSGFVGIGSASPSGLIDADAGTGTGQVRIDGSLGACLMLRDTDDAGWTECDALDGVLTCSIDADGLCD